MGAPIYVVVCTNDLPFGDGTVDPDGPLVMETYLSRASLEDARRNAAELERRGRMGSCRIGRVVFDDEPGFVPPSA